MGAAGYSFVDIAELVGEHMNLEGGFVVEYRLPMRRWVAVGLLVEELVDEVLSMVRSGADCWRFDSRLLVLAMALD